MRPIQSKPTQIGHGLVIMPIQHQCSSNVLNWNSCQLSQWRANAAIICQCPEINTQWGSNQTQLNLTARRQVWGLTFCDLCEQVGRESQSSTIYANPSPIEYQFAANWNLGLFIQRNNQLSLYCQYDANWHPMWHQLSVNIIQIYNQWNANWHPMWHQLSVNIMQIYNQWNANWHPSWCYLNANAMPIEYQRNANWLPIDCQWSVTQLQQECQLTANRTPMDY